MKRIKTNLSLIIIPLIILILASELSLIAVTIINQNASQRQRDRNRETTLTVLRESYSQKCLLLVPNGQRIPATVDKCDKEAQAKVNKIQ